MFKCEPTGAIVNIYTYEHGYNEIWMMIKIET